MRQLAFGLELDVSRHSRLFVALFIFSPLLGEVQALIHQGNKNEIYYNNIEVLNALFECD